MIYLLHISDLHLVTDPQWNNMKNAILYSVREKLNRISCGQKLLVITGDFHNFVQNDYIQAGQFLSQLFEAMGIEPDKDVFVIPGNHDVSAPAPGDSERALIVQAVKSDPTMLQSGLNKLLLYYDNYIKFIQALNIYPTDCDKLPVHVHVRTWRNKLNLLHLNTTLIADGGKKGQVADTSAATSDEIRRQLRFGNLPSIAIGHNSYYDLSHDQQKQLSALFLQENISAYLCGDRHQRNSVREENRIILNNKLSAVTIPNIVSYKSSTDEGDTYSDFGMIWHVWDEKTGCVNLEFMRWDPEDQAELQPDGKDSYDFRKPYNSVSSTPSTDIDDCWLLNKTILEKSKIAVKNFHVRNFLRGGRCEWNLAFSDRIVSRDIVEKLYDCAVEGGIYALVGPGGEGKTTILRQLCAKLILEEIPVFYYRGYGTLNLPTNIPDQAVFVVDNPSNTMEVKRFLNTVIENGQTLILGARQNEWNLLKMFLKISDRDVSEIPLQTLTVKESWRFAECISDNLNCSKSKKDIKDLFLNNSYGFLYAAMLMVVNNKNSLEEIAYEIINNLSEQSHKSLLLLAHIVLSEWCGVKFTYAQFKPVCNKLNISPREANKALSREISLNGDVYQTRHDIISKLFYKELFSDSGLLLLDETDDILENLMLFYLKRYQTSYGRIKNIARNSIMQLSGSLPQASLNTQKYLINRILDEVKSETTKIFYQLPSYIDNEEVQLLFYQQCFEREYISLDFLLKWCHLLLRNGIPWTIDEPYSPAWIMRKACIKYNADSDTWLAWARMEAQQNHMGDYHTENSARWIFREACIKRNANSHVWLAWAQMEAQESHVGDYHTENSARWIFREACIKHNADSHTWLAWAQMEAQQNHVGDYHTENSARWIFHEACMKRNAGGNIWMAWAQMEAQQNHVGDYHTENSARWIFREACMNHNTGSDNWLAWAQMEAQQNHVGDYHTENSARWIFRETCVNHNAGSDNWLAWAQMEAQESHVGDYHTENSARWIFREACMNRNADSHTWLAWAQMEAQQNQVGGYDTENSARWIFREACMNHNAQNDTWLAWAQMEMQQNHVGDYDTENSARWIFREACMNHNANSNVWLAWAQMEAQQNHVGDYNTENSARWIFHEACVNRNADSKTWMAWAQMEAQQNQVGDYHTENSARWIFREACMNRNADSHTWLAWAQMEAQQNQVGDYHTENSARWIFSKGIERFPKSTTLYRSYAQMELSVHSVEKARNILRQSLRYSNFSIGLLAILEFYCGNIDSEDIFCTNNLMMQMEEQTSHSLVALLYLYYCCLLLNRTKDAEEYHRQLLQKPEYDPSDTYIESFIQLCREALT